MNPKTEIRRWIQDQLEEGDLDELDEMVDGAVARFAADATFCDRLVRYEIQQCVRATYPVMTRQVRTQPAQLRQEIEREARSPNSPFPQLPKPDERNIFVDLARMTKIEVLGLASKLEDEASTATVSAALCRVVASQLSDTERVADRFSREDLYRLHGKIHINPKTEIYVGEKRFSLVQGKAI